jgi:hypothetical protein
MKPSLRQRYGLFRFKLKSRKKHCVGWRVSDVRGLLQKLEQHQVPAVVLRWFDEVPRNRQEEQQAEHDVDLLIAGSGLETATLLAAQQPGPFRCDVYTDVGVKGSTYTGMPYYPPVLAQELLRERTLYDSTFFVPKPHMHLNSLMYHLTYQKGLDSGIPTGCHLATAPAPKRNYGQRLLDLAGKVGVKLQTPLTLTGLHQKLKERGWNMPLDLLARWPRKTAWHEWLFNQEKQLLQPFAEALPQLIVFFIREDAHERGMSDSICGMLAEKFAILAREALSPPQIDRVMRQVRGANWVQYGKSTTVRPHTAVVCYDFNPIALGAEGIAHQASRSNKEAYAFVENQNLFIKHEIRKQLRQLVPDLPRMNLLHGSDNPYEAQHMLHAIYGEGAPQMNRRFLENVAVIRSQRAPRRVA